MKKSVKKAPAKERKVQEEYLRATTGGSGYMIAGGDGAPPDPDPTAGT